MQRTTIATVFVLAGLVGGTVWRFSPPAGAAFFDDVPEDHPSMASIDWLTEGGYAQGYEDGSFRPEQPVNRAEFVRLLIRTMPSPIYSASCPTSPFSDITPSFWFYKDLCKAYRAGIIEGFPDGTFRGAQTVTLAEAAKMLVQARSIAYTEWEEEAWYKPYVTALYLLRTLPASVRDPDQLLTRGEVAEILYRLEYVTAVPATETPVTPPSSSSAPSSTPAATAALSDVSPCPPVISLWTQTEGESWGWRLLYSTCVRESGSSAEEGDISLAITAPSGASYVEGPGTSEECEGSGNGVTCSSLTLHKEVRVLFSLPSTMSGSVTFTSTAATSREEENTKNNGSLVYVYLPVPW
ncbi:MAG: S-layer homology domain-containing protein [Candidatus Peribacteraceae bacterium]